MAWKSVLIPPGVNRWATPNDTPNAWWDTNNVRFLSDAIQPIGGCTRMTSTALSSKIRKLFQWRDNNDGPYIVAGGEGNVYVYTSTPYDVTPATYVQLTNDGSGGGYGIGPYGEDPNPVYTTGSPATVTFSGSTLTWTAHGLAAGDYVKFTTTGTLPTPLNNTSVYRVLNVLTANTFEIATLTGSTKITTSSGSGTHSVYKVTYTVGAYGQPRSTNPVQFRRPDFWSFSNFGENLLSVASQDGRLFEFIPTTGTPGKMNVVFATATASATVTITNASPGVVTWTGHGLSAGDKVRFTSTSSLPAPLSNEKRYFVKTVLTADTFTVADTAAGAAINTTTAGSGTFTGYKLPAWEAPTSNRAVLVSAERSCVLLGANGEPRRVAWSDFEDYGGWDFANANGEAGYVDLESTSPIVNGIRVKEGILILTQHEAFLMRFVGAPYIYGVEKIGTTSFFAPNCIAASGNLAVWLGLDGFWQFDGSSVKPLPCPFFNDLKNDFNPVYGDFRSHMHASGSYPEFWLDYVSKDADDAASPFTGECDKYVIFSFAEGWWARGSRSRSAATGATTGGFPVAAGLDRQLYQHEDGLTDAGAPRGSAGNIWAETTVIPLSASGQIVDITQMLVARNPSTAQNYRVKVLSKFTPDGSETTKTYTPRADGYIDTRSCGRDIRLRIEATNDDYWSIGLIRMNVTENGGDR